MLISLSVVLALFAVLVGTVWWIAMAWQFLGEGDPVPPEQLDRIHRVSGSIWTPEKIAARRERALADAADPAASGLR